MATLECLCICVCVIIGVVFIERVSRHKTLVFRFPCVHCGTDFKWRSPQIYDYENVHNSVANANDSGLHPFVADETIES